MNQVGGSRGNVGEFDPREMARELTSVGCRAWLDVDRMGTGELLFETLAGAILDSKLAILCVSDEYAQSKNCKRELKYIIDKVEIPYIVVITGEKRSNWQRSALGLLTADTLYIDTTGDDKQTARESFKKIRITVAKALGVNTLKGRASVANANTANAIQEAAENGDAESQYRIGLKFALNHDVANAFEWCLKSATQGYVLAQVMLGDMYCSGDLLEVDLAVAMEWFSKAAVQGNDYAGKRLQTLKAD
ncbi:Leucine-rich repeat serine/threonine-protein kinase 2 [Podochytrium sp. JEL0797]|nr:Leucine-rich repeat serine/threonine-protein kinase 2 [Podochytrium sp. JEL0797]